MCDCNDNIDILSSTGPQGTSIVSATSTTVVGGQNITLGLSNGGSLTPFFVPNGTAGSNGRGIVSIVFLSSNVAPGNIAGLTGATDTYQINYTDATTSTFIVKNGVDGVTQTASNIGIFKEVYKAGTSNPFEYRTLGNTDGTITVTQNTNDIDFKLNTGLWITASAQGTAPNGFNVVYSAPGSGFTSIANASGYNSVAFKKDLVTNKVVMRGAAKLTGPTVIGMNPSGSFAKTSLILFIPSHPNFVVTPGVQAVATCQLFNNSMQHFSTGCIVATSTDISLIVDHRLNYVDQNTLISFENTSFSISNV
jgi:hypothetical protein